MTAPVITFFNNKSGVGTTTLVYHLASMYSQLGMRVVAVDLDPQANLTAAFLDEDELIDLWPADRAGDTVYGTLAPLLRGIGDIGPTSMVDIDERLAPAPGDLALSRFEDELSSQWPGRRARTAGPLPSTPGTSIRTDEIRRLCTIFVSEPGRAMTCPEAWSRWRRHHQHRDRTSHYQRQEVARART